MVTESEDISEDEIGADDSTSGFTDGNSSTCPLTSLGRRPPPGDKSRTTPGEKEKVDKTARRRASTDLITMMADMHATTPSWVVQRVPAAVAIGVPVGDESPLGFLGSRPTYDRRNNPFLIKDQEHTGDAKAGRTHGSGGAMAGQAARCWLGAEHPSVWVGWALCRQTSDRLVLGQGGQGLGRDEIDKPNLTFKVVKNALRNAWFLMRTGFFCCRRIFMT
ncbi:hypothetical protein E2562_005861 [Oryza meyeriana var. granulata]|uniref:Uncharacterized protein n=1 Tax=Oryza meyeriana var. granulata TaxID=110450 RepID=A0A6G1DV11_9ORYZ|nr:hypothetical protein E2562_005861 [Oryza meyeriana var. granulata]